LAITATNNGTTAVTFTGITASGDFNETENCTKAPLQPGTNCVINVTYTPSTAGASLGSLTLADNAPGSPQIVLLSGTGFGQQSDFALSATPSSASVPAGKSATYTLQLSSVGGFNQPVSVSCQGLPSGANCLLPSNGVIPSEPASVTLTVATATRASAPPIWRIRLDPNGQKWNYFSATVLTILILLLAVSRMSSRPSVRHATVMFGAVVASILLVAACNSGGQANVPAGTPAGAYQITVMATSGSITHSITVGLQVN
jgi:Abnormal spindle-like microcephaly-assoc'd, ASPM-SPD-2-Hydin